MSRPPQWPALPYEQWRDTCDTLHAHTQVLGKLAAARVPLAPDRSLAAVTRDPAAPGFAAAPLAPPEAQWNAALGEYVLDWDDVRSAADPHGAALAFTRSAVRHACAVCGWDDALAASAHGRRPPIV